MRFVKQENNRDLKVSIPYLPEDNKPVFRKPGLYKGQIVMADDFDAPLDDFKEYS
jgi:hypothetical protein